MQHVRLGVVSLKTGIRSGLIQLTDLIFTTEKRSIDCPLCNAWLLYKERQIQAVPAGESPQQTKRQALQAARWAKSQCNEGTLRGYLDHNIVGKQYAGYFDDPDVQAADQDAQADPRF